MSRLDFTGLKDFWYRIGDIFARRSDAIGSISFDGSSGALSWSKVDGSGSHTANLDGVFAKDTEAGNSLGISGRTITLSAVNGASLGSVTVPETDTSSIYSYIQRYYIASVGITSSGNSVTINFYNGEGTRIDYVSFNVQ